MMDVDALSRIFGPLIAFHYSIANIIHEIDIRNRLDGMCDYSHTSTKSCYSTSSAYFAILPIYLKKLLLRNNNIYVHNMCMLSIQIEPDVIEHHLY